MAGSSAGELAPATITDLVTGDVIKCMFRPKEYTFSKQNTWQPEKVKGKNVPQLEFGGGGAATMTMELFFDTYDNGEGSEDVRRKFTNKLWNLMKINPGNKNPRTKKSEPPKVEFRCGTSWSFKAVITQMTQKFTLFKRDGTPVRAVCNITFQQAAEQGEYPFQNPTSQALAGYKMRTVREGDMLDWLAFEEYGSATLWRHIADANSLDDPMALRPGQVLLIPPL